MRILLAVDGSPYSQPLKAHGRLFPAAMDISKQRLPQPRNIVPPAAELGYDAAGNLEETRRQITSQAKRLTDEVAARVRASGFTVETAVRHGDPRSVIIDEQNGMLI